MRIRTIKPEFWSHPVMVRQSDLTNLLAIALLNYADDEGYFYADEDMIRGSLFPKKDSTMIRRSIDELSRIGYLSVSEHPTHGPIGMIVSFSDHQRIDRPKSSIIKEFYDSTNDRRIIDDESLLEQGTGNRERKGKHMSDKSDELAEMLWMVFPPKSRTRSSKEKLLQAIKKAKVTEDAETIRQRLLKWTLTEEWTKEGGQFVSGAHLWFKDGKFKDDPPEEKAISGSASFVPLFPGHNPNK